MSQPTYHTQLHLGSELCPMKYEYQCLITQYYSFNIVSILFSGAPNFECICDLGWTSKDNHNDFACDVDCGCNFVSSCSNGPGIKSLLRVFFIFVLSLLFCIRYFDECVTSPLPLELIPCNLRFCLDEPYPDYAQTADDVQIDFTCKVL